MKCPNCQAELVKAQRDRIDVEACPSCNGIWLTRRELEELEDEEFDFGDDKKGSLVFESTPSARLCPECGKAMRSFEYRLYDLELELCIDGHGYWLDQGEDKRVLELMRKEEQGLERKMLAEDRWAAHLRHWRSGAFLDKIKNLFR